MQYLDEFLNHCLEEGLQESRVSNSSVSTDASPNVISVASRSSNKSVEKQRHPILGKFPESRSIPVRMTTCLDIFKIA